MCDPLRRIRGNGGEKIGPEIVGRRKIGGEEVVTVSAIHLEVCAANEGRQQDHETGEDWVLKPSSTRVSAWLRENG